MAESTLSYTLTDLQADVGGYLGWGRGVAAGDPAWNTQKQGLLDAFTKSGVRQFYFPPPLPGHSQSYDWSFLKPVTTLALASGNNTAALPADYGGIEGRITVSATGGQSYWPIDLMGVGTLYAKQSAFSSATGRPEIACVEPLRGTTLNTGQRFQLRVWPTADAAYTLQLRYYLLADALTGLLPYVYGGAQHTETVLESCLAIAEQRLDDIQGGVHTMKFMERLAASISQDRKNKPQLLGYNGDRSDRLASGRGDRRDWYGFPGITVNGVQY